MLHLPQGEGGAAGARRNAGSRRQVALAALVLGAAASAAAADATDLLPALRIERDLAPGAGPHTYVATGDDPSLTVTLEPPRRLGAATDLVVEMRATRPAAAPLQATVYVKAVPEGTFRAEASVRARLAADGAWHRYRVRLAGGGVPPEAAALRLDPFDGRGAVEIRRLELAPSPSPDPAGQTWRGDDLALEWIPGPGLAPQADGSFRVTGREAWLSSPSWLQVDAGRVTQIEVQLGSSTGAPGRLCYAAADGAPDAGCVPIPRSAPERVTTHYLGMLLRPGWSDAIGRLRLEPLGPDPAPGAVVQVASIRTVPLHADPVTTVFVRRAALISRLNPTGFLAAVLLLLALFLGGAAVVLERVAPPRTPEAPPGGRFGPQRAVDAGSLAGALGALVLLAAFPFESYPLLSSRLGHGNVEIPTLLVGFAAALGLVRRLLFIPRPTLLPALERPAAALLLALLATSLLSADRAMSLAYLQRYYAAFVAALLAGAWAPVRARTFRGVLGALVAVTAWISAVGVLQAIGLKDVLYGGYFRAFHPLFFHANLRPKAFSSIGHPTPLATLLLVLLPLSVYVGTRAAGRLGAAGAAASALGLLCFLLTFSRGAYVALALALPLLGRAVPAGRRRHAGAAAAVIALVAAAILVARTPRGALRPIGPGEGRLGREGGDASIWAAAEGGSVFVSHRLLGARLALALAREAPILGSGLGQLHARYDDLLPPGVARRNPIWSTADSAYLTLLSEGGVLGLGALLWLLLGTGRLLWLVSRRRADGDDGPLAAAALAGLAGFAAHLGVYDGLHWYTAPVMSGLALGLVIASLDHMGRERVAPDSPCG